MRYFSSEHTIKSTKVLSENYMLNHIKYEFTIADILTLWWLYVPHSYQEELWIQTVKLAAVKHRASGQCYKIKVSQLHVPYTRVVALFFLAQIVKSMLLILSLQFDLWLIFGDRGCHLLYDKPTYFWCLKSMLLSTVAVTEWSDVQCQFSKSELHI